MRPPRTREEYRAVLRAGIARLEPRQAEAMELIHLLGYTASEAAKKMGISRTAVNNLCARGHVNLEAEIACLTNRNQARD